MDRSTEMREYSACRFPRGGQGLLCSYVPLRHMWDRTLMGGANLVDGEGISALIYDS